MIIDYIFGQVGDTKMTMAVQSRTYELTEMEEIKALRKGYRESNEAAYADGGVMSLTFTLSSVCGQNIYEGKEAAAYFEILDTRDFLQEKYIELSNLEMMNHKEDVEITLGEAEDMLNFLGKYVS